MTKFGQGQYDISIIGKFQFQLKKENRGDVLYINGKKITETLGKKLSLIPLMFDDTFLVSIKDKKDPEDNLYGIDTNGDVIWKLNEKNYLGLRHSFFSPFKDKEGNLWIINRGGKHFMVDHKTGRILRTKYNEIDYEISADQKGIRINGKESVFIEKIKFIFPYKGEILIVLLEKPGEDNNNVYAFNSEGALLWRPKFEHQRIFSFATVQEGSDKIFMFEAEEVFYEFDPKTGKHLNPHGRRR